MTPPHPTQATIHPYEDFEYYEHPPASPPLPTHPAPQYQLSPGSPPLSHISGRFSSDRGTSTGQDESLGKDKLMSPSSTITRYSEVASPDPEAVRRHSGEKEVYQYKAYPLAAAVPDPSPPSTGTPKGQRKRICGMPKKICLIAFALLLCAIIAIAAGLGVHFGTKKSAADKSSSSQPSATGSPPQPTGDSDYQIGGDLSPEYYSASGAFNGSGIAIASVNFGIDSSIYVYFQKYTGEIMQYIAQANGGWNEVTTIATNARNGTPLSAVAYLVDEVATWHLFYIDDEANMVQRTSSNSSTFQTNIWQDGPLNALNLKANEADMIGMQACYWGNFYGDSDNTYTDGFNVTQASNTTAPPQTGMHLWYASSDTTFEQFSWTNGDNQWTRDQQWTEKNGRAGIGCQTWLDGTTSYVTMINLENTLEIWWKDTNVTLDSTSAHPINQWVNSSVAIPNVHPSSSMGYTNYLTYQFDDETIRGVNVSWAAENTSFYPAADGSSALDEWTIPQKGVPGTHMSITALADASGGAHLAVFFQTDGDDFKMFSRDNSAGSWTYADVPVNGIN